MTNLEKIEKIEEAINLIDDAYKIVKEVVKGTSIEDNFYAYSGYGFDTLLGEGNKYDKSLYDLIRFFSVNCRK